MKTKQYNSKELWIYDAYNVIHCCRLFKDRDDESLRLEMGRDRLMRYVETHSVYYECDACVVFDSSSRLRSRESQQKIKNQVIEVLYATRKMNADSLIERRVKLELEKGTYGKITIVTSDRLESDLVFGMGAHTCLTYVWFDRVCQIEKGKGGDFK